jgi:outer membrane protein TolC
LARRNYPLVKQKDLIRQTADISIENLDKGFLPQFSLNAQATYQSAVTKIDVPIPGVKFNSLSRDQYKLVADVNQLVYDGGVTKQQKLMQQLNARVEDQKIEVELYMLKQRISQIYLSILYLDEQLHQVDLVKTDLQTGIKQVQAQVQNGVAFKSNLNLLQAELLKADQRLIELQSSRKGLTETLGLFLGQDVPENMILEKPVVQPAIGNSLNRPEIKLYDNQSRFFEQQNKIIHSKNLPKTSLFVQGGYGRPGLDLLKNEFDFFYIGGIRFNWLLGGLYTSKREKQLVDINKKIVDIQKETFLLNTNTQIKQQQSEIEKLEKLVASDDAIIDLRTKVKDAARAQLENGVITANDYLREVNAEDQARQTLITHQLQLLEAKINYQNMLGE